MSTSDRSTRPPRGLFSWSSTCRRVFRQESTSSCTVRRTRTWSHMPCRRRQAARVCSILAYD